MDICTKVTLRQRLLPSGKITLYLDYYSAIRNPKTNKSQRHEYMGIYLYGNPTTDMLTMRYDRLLFTIITTNLTPQEIREKYGDRIADRLNEMMVKIVFENPTYRKP